jgi:hypothetical protein
MKGLKQDVPTRVKLRMTVKEGDVKDDQPELMWLVDAKTGEVTSARAFAQGEVDELVASNKPLQLIFASIFPVNAELSEVTLAPRVLWKRGGLWEGPAFALDE